MAERFPLHASLSPNKNVIYKATDKCSELKTNNNNDFHYAPHLKQFIFRPLLLAKNICQYPPLLTPFSMEFWGWGDDDNDEDDAADVELLWYITPLS